MNRLVPTAAAVCLAATLVHHLTVEYPNWVLFTNVVVFMVGIPLAALAIFHTNRITSLLLIAVAVCTMLVPSPALDMVLLLCISASVLRLGTAARQARADRLEQ